MWQILLMIFMTFCFSVKARDIAVFDTDLCVKNLSVPKNFSVQDLSKDNFNCASQEMISGRRMIELSRHGEYVLKRLFDIYKPRELINVYYFSVFEKGHLKEAKIQSALKHLKKLKVDFILFAGGLPVKTNSLKEELMKASTQFLVPTGQIGRGILKETRLWPQNFGVPKIMVGYYKQLLNSPRERIFANGQLNEDLADIFLPHRSKKSKLKYSSLAVTNLAGLVLQYCRKLNRACLKKIGVKEKIDDRPVQVLKKAYLEEI